MPRYPLILHPNPVLHTQCAKVVSWDTELLLLIEQIRETMHDAAGIGLAAPQIGKTICLCVIHKTVFHGISDLILLNPEIVKKSRETIWGEEGCLSIPNMWGEVRRYKEITVKALNEKKENVVFDANALLSRVIQHEIDHLNGLLFIDKRKNVRNIRSEIEKFVRGNQ